MRQCQESLFVVQHWGRPELPHQLDASVHISVFPAELFDMQDLGNSVCRVALYTHPAPKPVSSAHHAQRHIQQSHSCQCRPANRWSCIQNLVETQPHLPYYERTKCYVGCTAWPIYLGAGTGSPQHQPGAAMAPQSSRQRPSLLHVLDSPCMTLPCCQTYVSNTQQATCTDDA
jgi:hypothetical protein